MAAPKIKKKGTAKTPAAARQGAIPCLVLVLIGLILIGLLLFAALKTAG
jgi:hypothetical protein